MKQIKIDLKYINKLVKQLLTDSAVGFVVLAVLVTIMSVFLGYKVAPMYLRQLESRPLGGISQIVRPTPSITETQVTPELAQPIGLATGTAPVPFVEPTADSSDNEGASGDVPRVKIVPVDSDDNEDDDRHVDKWKVESKESAQVRD